MNVIPNDVVLAAQRSYAKYGVFASVTIAQWALESGFGKHMPTGSNNPFGIKAVGNQPYVAVRTFEYKDVANSPERYTITANFRKFDSIDAAFSHHAALLSSGKPYQKLKAITDPIYYAKSLTGIYATDPNYGKSLQTIMAQYDLLKYDIKVKDAPNPDIQARIVFGGIGASIVTGATFLPKHNIWHFDWSQPAIFGLGLIVGILSVLLLASILHFRSNRSPDDRLTGLFNFQDKDFEMAIRAAAQPLIDFITALKVKADAHGDLQAANDKLIADLAAANAQIETLTQDDADTDAAIASAAGFNNPT